MSAKAIEEGYIFDKQVCLPSFLSKIKIVATPSGITTINSIFLSIKDLLPIESQILQQLIPIIIITTDYTSIWQYNLSKQIRNHRKNNIKVSDLSEKAKNYVHNKGMQILSRREETLCFYQEPY